MGVPHGIFNKSDQTAKVCDDRSFAVQQKQARRLCQATARMAMAALQGLLWHPPCGATGVVGILGVR
jgi:hypothetical protein